MSCKKWEESIYLYEELTGNEQAQLDDHLVHCADCAVLFQSTRQMQGIVKGVADNKVTVRDASLLTNKIMRVLPTKQTSSVRLTNVFTSLMESLFARYTLGATSLVLIFFFFNEQQKENHLPKQEIVFSKSKAKIPLDTQAFMKAITQEKPAENSLYLCIKNNNCDYEIVKMYKQKKNHESI